MTTFQAVSVGIPRWIALAMPDDAEQELALANLWGRTPDQRREILRWRIRELRRTQWERRPTRPADRPRCLRPSRQGKGSGYRTDSARHSDARMTLTSERRKQIAAMGQAALRARKG